MQRINGLAINANSKHELSLKCQLVTHVRVTTSVSLHVMSSILVLVLAALLVGLVGAAIPPTKFLNGDIYILENQQSGKYLTAGPNGEYILTNDKGTPTGDQKWRFVTAKDPKIGQAGWQLQPLSGVPASSSVYNEVYTEHGKFLFRSISTGKCIDASGNGRGTGMEVRCDSKNLFQRWFPKQQTD